MNRDVTKPMQNAEEDYNSAFGSIARSGTGEA